MIDPVLSSFLSNALTMKLSKIIFSGLERAVHPKGSREFGSLDYLINQDLLGDYRGSAEGRSWIQLAVDL
jgi:hypothetical protein